MAMDGFLPQVDGPEGVAAEVLLARAKGLADEVWTSRADLDPSLFQGLSGAAILFAHLALVEPADPVWAERAEGLIAASVARIGETSGAGLFDGYSGVGWTLSRLRRMGVVDSGADDALETIDGMVAEALEGWSKKSKNDLTDGIAGLGVYGLERSDTDGGRIAKAFLEKAEALAVPAGEGILWLGDFDYLSKWYPEVASTVGAGGEYMITGVAHGAGGILGVLARMVRSGWGQRAERLLADGVRGLLSLRFGEPFPSLPAFIVPGRPVRGAYPKPSWCYGDLGVAASLAGWMDPESGAWVEGLARGAAGVAVDNVGDSEAGFCHGGAGNSHLFRQLHRQYGDAVFKARADEYLQFTMDCLDRDAPGPGLVYYGPMGPIRSLGLLQGSVGAGLALISALEKTNPWWDRVFLVDLPTATPAVG
jgi:hypothetical protein